MAKTKQVTALAGYSYELWEISPGCASILHSTKTLLMFVSENISDINSVAGWVAGSVFDFEYEE